MHDATNRGIQRLVFHELDLIANLGGTTGSFASRITDCGSALISVETLYRHPDTQFIYPSAHYPGVVIEISYSQAWKHIDEKARRFIRETRGQIAVVLNIDFPDYSEAIKNNRNKTTLSIWRVHRREAGDEADALDVQTQEFRSSAGHAVNSDKTFSLSFQDLAPKHFRGGVEDVALSFSYKQLADIIDVSEEAKKVIESHDKPAENANNHAEFGERRPSPTCSPTARELARLRQAKLDARDKDYEPERDV